MMPEPSGEDARDAARGDSWARRFDALNGFFRFDAYELRATAILVARWLVLGASVGTLAGVASAVFLVVLAWATAARTANGWLLWLLPAAGFLLGWLYDRYGGLAILGNNLVIEEVHSNSRPIPLRMAPMVLVGTVLTHLFGGSAGREGTAIQMGSSLADGLSRLLRLSPETRRLMITAGIGGGFGAVFGTPLAGFVFALEVQRVGRIGYEGVVPAFVAAVFGDLVVRALGVPHAEYPLLANVGVDVLLLAKVGLAGIAFGLTSLLFIELTHAIRHLSRMLTRWLPLRLVVGGTAVILLTLMLGTTDYLGLSLPLIERSLTGAGVVALAFLLKLIFTATTLGTGYLGGEVTPLFVIGATLGYTLGRLLGVDPAFLATIGFVAVFAGAANTPLACTIMAVELFGGGSALYIGLGCFAAYLFSGHRGIYGTQRIHVPKVASADIQPDEPLEHFAARHPGWLPKRWFTGRGTRFDPQPGTAPRLGNDEDAVKQKAD